ncbi:hypothetical protein HYS72_03350 [Candidatus Pacearchaeota archaeon]|nr:hypothetical protein [Candidatus Pacearchaeota archaeon]MBI2057128.1 hypothetical protein [Candidatus Pacearchaeota archaeon]
MGFWINNFAEFERKQKRKNRLILNFSYISSSSERKNVKVFAGQNAKVPTKFISQEISKEILGSFSGNNSFGDLTIQKKSRGKFEVLNIEIPNERNLLNKLPNYFQIGNYDKLLRFGGFYPERKVILNSKLEKLFQNNQEIELKDLSGISFGDFLNEKELNSLPYIVLDIEKPLWKKDFEKRELRWRNNILKSEKKYFKLPEAEQEKQKKKHEQRQRIIKNLEDKLTIEVENVGKIKLYDENFDSEVSYVGAIWGKGKEKKKEMYVIDPKDEIICKKYNGFKILKFKNEKELILGFLDSLHKRNPIISYGHNQVYDMTQLRFAAEDNKIIYDPAVKEVKPRRDFVRSFLQRLREDMVYLDTLWLSKIFYPYLAQKRFNTSHKLASVAQFLDIDFTKSQTHEELRITELKRLVGETKEIRKKAIDEMLFYSCGDLDVTQNIVDRINFLPLLVKMKNILPFSTLSEIAFSTNSMNKLHEFNHFKENGNLPYYGYASKERQDKLQIFKKRFVGIKNELLGWAKFKKADKGEYENVQEFYLPLEDWTKDIAFKINPELEKAYNETKNNKSEHFAFLQYLKSYMKEIFADYYFVRRDEKIYQFTKNFLKLDNNALNENFNKIKNSFGGEKLNKVIGSFRYLKNHFRSIYSSLEGKERGIIRPAKTSIQRNLFESEFPDIMENDSDLFLLKENSESIRKNLSPANARNLNSFLENFETFENYLNSNTNGLSANNEGGKTNTRDLIYSYIYLNRFSSGRKRFFGVYGVSIDELNDKISEGYKNLFEEATQKNLKFLDNIGDYIFVQGEGNLDSAVKVRDLEKFVVE